MASYLAGIHSTKKESKALYWRKLRDTVGHGECLMGVFDTYPDGIVPYHEMTGINEPPRSLLRGGSFRKK